MQYLGHVVSAQGVEPDPAKIQAVATYPVPRNVKELRQFLGLSNYLHAGLLKDSGAFVQAYPEERSSVQLE